MWLFVYLSRREEILKSSTNKIKLIYIKYKLMNTRKKERKKKQT